MKLKIYFIFKKKTGKQLVGKATWNDAARNYIKNVGNVMEQLGNAGKKP